MSEIRNADELERYLQGVALGTPTPVVETIIYVALMRKLDHIERLLEERDAQPRD
jgi:hypothetical protein